MAGQKIRQPHASEYFIGALVPYIQLLMIQFHTLERKKHAYQLPVSKCEGSFKFCALLQNTLLRKYIIDPINPIIQIPAAAL